MAVVDGINSLHFLLICAYCIDHQLTSNVTSKLISTTTATAAIATITTSASLTSVVSVASSMYF